MKRIKIMRGAPPELVEAARQGDQQALANLLAQCQPDVRRYARRICATEDLEEAVQDALLVLYRRLGTLRVIATFSGWLFQIVKRECLRRLKRRLGEDRTGPYLGGEKDRIASQVGLEADLELRIDLARSINALPGIYRDVLILRDVNELSAEETARKVGVSVMAIKSRLHRARYLVRQQLSPSGG